MTHPLDPEHVKRLVRAGVIQGRCDTCNHTVKDGCSHVDCPHRKAHMYAPRNDGAIGPRHSPGSRDWSDDF